MKQVLPLSLVLLFLTAGCGSGAYESVASSPKVGADMSRESAPADMQGRTAVAASNVSYAHRQVVRKAQLGVRVKNVEEAEKRATAMIGQAGGYVEGTTSSDLAGVNARIALTARVPVAKFDEMMNQFASLGVAVSKTISGEDVTAQLFDLDARLKTLNAEEETLRGFLKGSRDINTMMDVQRRITDVRTEIETLGARRKNVAELAALSTIQLTLSQSAEYATVAKRDQNWALEAWGQASGAFMGLIRTLGTMVIWVAVCSPIWLPLLILLRLTWRRVVVKSAVQ